MKVYNVNYFFNVYYYMKSRKGSNIRKVATAETLETAATAENSE
jgi:hypothetical protein